MLAPAVVLTSRQPDLSGCVYCICSDGSKQIIVGGFRRDLEILDSDGHRLPGMMCVCAAPTSEGSLSYPVVSHMFEAERL